MPSVYHIRGTFREAGLDIIQLTTNVTLSTNMPDVITEITVEGDGFTVDADNIAGSVFLVDTTGTLILNRVTITGAIDGGITNEGTAELIDSLVTLNVESGIQNDANAKLTLTNTIVSFNLNDGDGGGIDNEAELSLINSTVADNEAEWGGGIYNNDGDVTLTNSIVAYSPSGGDCSPAVTDGGNNFDDDGTCGAGFGTITGLDPVLADNGGPTLTHALLPGSSAIDAIPDGECVDDNAAPLTTDQRGVPRPADGDAVPGALCDSGSYELAAGACCTDGPGTDSPCVVTNEVDCESGGGLFLGPGSECVSDDECNMLLVTMDAMSAVATGDGVLVRWTTALELDTASFQVLREAAQSREKAEPLLIPVGPRIHAMGDHLNGASYELLDDSRGARQARRYYIEDTDLYGRVTRHGPIEVARNGREAPRPAGRRRLEARR